MTGEIIYMTAGFFFIIGFAIYSQVKYARLEMKYYNLRRVNKILQERLAKSEERPF